MEKDRDEIVKIISDMFDSRNECGVYETTEAYSKLEKYIDGVRAEAIGWCHADACATLDQGDDPRNTEIPAMYARALVDLKA